MKVVNASTQKVTSVLRRAGFKSRQRVTTAVKGYHVTHESGYDVYRLGGSVYVTHDPHAYYIRHGDQSLSAKVADYEARYAAALTAAGLTVQQ